MGFSVEVLIQAGISNVGKFCIFIYLRLDFLPPKFLSGGGTDVLQVLFSSGLRVYMAFA